MSAESNTARLLALRPVMEAFLKGEKIEVRLHSHGEWGSCTGPKWHPDAEYRVKKEPRVYYVAVATAANTSWMTGYTEVSDERSYIASKSKPLSGWEIVKVVEEVSS